jgi:hypothetical protein
MLISLCGCVWMLILETLVLNWFQYQISNGITLGAKSNSIIWMTMYCLLEFLEVCQCNFLFGCAERMN